MSKIEIYTGRFCPYCLRAKALLQRRGLTFVEYNVEEDPGKRQEMLERSQGARTIPQIFINGRHVGGCDELYALDANNELEAWLSGD